MVRTIDFATVDNGDGPALAFSIGVARNNAEEKYCANNTYFPFFSYLIIGAARSKNDGWYESLEVQIKRLCNAIALNSLQQQLQL